MREPKVGDIYDYKYDETNIMYIKILKISKDLDYIKYYYIDHYMKSAHMNIDAFLKCFNYLKPEEYTDEVKILLAEEMIKDIIE
jgi:hypothetical protein